MIKFKEFNDLIWFFDPGNSLDPKLIEVLQDIVPLIRAVGPQDAVITSAHRDSGIHGTNPLRALDLRNHTLAEEDIVGIAHQINSKWVYDDEREDMIVCFRHDIGLGDHFHIQVHPNTHRR